MADDADDLEKGLRFMHLMGMQTKVDVSDLMARVLALTEELAARGQVNLRSLDERRERLRREEGERERTRAHVMVSAPIDKYAMQGNPEVPCAELMPICKSRCCKLDFALSFQDLDERVVAWDYGRPYAIRHGADGYCVHNVRETGNCGVYQHRPAICRGYDCRTDKRIWLDFEKRIPAEDLDLVQLRTPPK